MTSFDKNGTGFGTTLFDSEVTNLSKFKDYYQANIIQSKQKRYKRIAMSPLQMSLPVDNAPFETEPLVEVVLANDALNKLADDFVKLKQLEEFIRHTPGMMEEYGKWMTWQTLKN